MSDFYRHKMIQQGVDLHSQATKLELALRVLMAHDGEMAVCNNTLDELREAARSLNHQAIEIIKANDGATEWAEEWERNRLS